jgi:GT2 family glycosyltransferase
MAANGINAVRTYTAPPVWLLDAAQRHGLYVMVGLPWEQHIAFLDKRGLASDIEARVRRAVRDCGGHPAVLAYVIGNEIPASIVRWHGARRIERFLHRLYNAAKAEAPDTLVTYVNFPTTEYLQLPFLDFCCFNVYLERREQLEAYLAQLQNVAGDRPLVMAEIGLDSRRNGDINQAEVLDWQIRSVFTGGCSGVFLFAWTDEWYRGGYDIEDWDFGLTRRDRQPKPALTAVRTAFSQIPFPADVDWPRISVVVCTYNGSSTIRDTLDALQFVDYPDYEVIVVDDGSTDHTTLIASEYQVRVIRTENRGLSAARNTGMEAASGSIVAYTDDDAYPDEHWLKYLAWTFMTTSFVGVGGPNIPPPGDGRIAECVAHAPGGPIHVLISAQEAEHIPGCNCAFRKDALQAVGGFDPIFRAAGDDVDLCWRLMERGWEIGFQPAATVWHHRRNSLRTYWKQQKGYGKAEALLERKWPSKYNAAGHVT